MSSSEPSSSDSESGSISQALPQRGTQRKHTFEPPQGAVLISGPDSDGGVIETGEFDWNSIKDDKNIELWLVRIPNSVCPFRGSFLFFWSVHRILSGLASIPRAPDR